MDANGLSILNPQPTKLPGPDLLHQLVKPSSNLTALEHLDRSGKTSLTYKELHHAADALARRIARIWQVTGRDLVVPVLIQQSPLLYISLLAILKAGGAFCPLNIDAPPERLKFILKDVSAQVVLVSKELETKIPRESDAGVIVVDVKGDDTETTATPCRTPNSEDLAYVMYTSGSTGTPKGVGLSHGAVTQALLAHDRHIPDFSRFLQFAAPTFDVSIFEIFFPLYRGSTLISVHRGMMLDDLPAVLREMEVDACELTPTVARSLLRKREQAPKLKLLLTIGEMLNASVVQEFGGSEDACSMLWAMYGPTEATIHCTLQSAASSSSSTGNIGTPLDTVSCFVIQLPDSPKDNAGFKILPQGEIGELAVGGHQLARGYVNRPEQTADVFIETSYGRIYRTGDKARVASDGTLECLGRLSDGQVKLRGQRMELGEVEQAILRTQGCHGAVAAVMKSTLVAFCAVDAGCTEDAIFENCSSWLPRFMVPGQLIIMKEFPRLASGKLDTKKLKADYAAQKSADEVEGDMLLKAQNEHEEEILRILYNALGVAVPRDRTLASAGVDSLVAIRLASSLRSSGFDASATGILGLRTVSDLCSKMSNHRLDVATFADNLHVSYLAHVNEISAQNPALKAMIDLVEDVLPCTPLQSAMLAETARDPQAYCNTVELEIDIDVSINQVSNTMRQLAMQNETLRMGFVPWGSSFASSIFKELRQGQIIQVEQFPHEFSFSKPEDWLLPFKVYLQARESGNGPRVLIHIHHAIYDGWSMDMMLTDLSAMLVGASVIPRTQFREVIKFYNHDLRKDGDNMARSFWTEHLLGWNWTPFPKLGARPSESKDISTTAERLDIDPKAMKEAALKVNCSVQVFFQAALALVWSQTSGSSDVVLGSVTSGRTIPVPGVEGIMGPCIASMPLRVNFSSMVANSDVLMNIRTSNRAIMQHCTLPLSEIKKLAGLQSAAQNLYEILLVYQESPDSNMLQSSGIKQIRHFDRLDTKLLVEVEPQRGGYLLQATYHSDSFSPTYVGQFIQQLKDVVRRLVHEPEGTIQSAKRAPETGLSIHRQVTETLHENKDLAALFEAAAVKNPNAPAVCFATSLTQTPAQTTTMSYEELNNTANQTAAFLHGSGAQPGDILAIAMGKSVSLYTSILGIVKAKCAYLPILPSTPIARVREIFRQAKIKQCLVDSHSWPRFTGIENVQFLDLDESSLDTFSAQNLNIPTDMSRLSYVIYTSGTTGVPKGVALTQKNIVSNILHLGNVYPGASKNSPRLLQACSQAFDVSVFEIFYTWHAGMCLCAATNDDLFEDLEHAIRQFEITHLSLTPTVASLINPRNVPSVEFLVTAGEPMTRSVADTWGDVLWQGYGPSETTNICSVKQMTRSEHIEHLGWGFPNTSVLVLDPKSMSPIPIGWVGEFCFGGDQVAQGYLNMPRLTSDKFIDHPEFGRLYRSGDIGRMLPDNSLVILGRIDDQVKLRGQRIETGEISGVITSTGEASSAVTMLIRREDKAPEQLASFYVRRRQDAEFGVLELDQEVHNLLFATLQSRVPSYMIPSFLVPVSLIPLSSSGKIDRKHLQGCFESLPKSYIETLSASTRTSEDDADWSPTERAVANVISRCTSVAKSDIGRWTPFATFGLDSISAIGVSREIALEFKVRVPVSAILQNPNVVQLAKFVDDGAVEHGSQGYKQLFPKEFIENVRESFARESKNVSDVLPCSPLQEAMLAHGQDSYYNKILLRLRVSPEMMREYWREICSRHDILRTCFLSTEDSDHPIAQVVLSNWEMPWKAFDVSELSLDGAIQEHLQTLPDPLDSKNPPLSLAIIRYRGSKFLSFICHHALYDGVAMENLWREIEALANGRALPPAVSYKPFLQEMLSLPDETMSFWTEHFRDFRTSTLFAQSAKRRIDQCTHSVSLDISFGDIQAQLQFLGVSMLSLCQATWANVLTVCCKEPDICFGNVMSGRSMGIEGLDRLVAPCFNTIPIRKDLRLTPQNIDLVRSFHKMNSELLRFQFTPLRMIQKLANRQRWGLFDTLLLLQRPLQEMDSNIWTLEEDSGDMDIPLVCEVVPCPNLNSVVINMHHDMGLVPGDIATTLADLFKYLLGAILSSPFAAPADRQTLPTSLTSGLQGLVVRKEKPEEIEAAGTTDERWADVESRVRMVFAKLSQVPKSKIRRHTTIFQLGLDSINAVQVASMLRSQGYNVSASDVVEYPSSAKLASNMTQPSTRDTLVPKPYDFDTFSNDVAEQVKGKLPTPDTIEAILPCTPLQSAMLASFLQSQGSNYLNFLSFKIDKGVQTGKLMNAWNSQQRRHPMLRTGFAGVHHPDSSFAMVRYSPTVTSFSNVEVRDELRDERKLLQWKSDVRQKLLNNTCLPPWQVALSEQGGQLRMHILIHHALYDAQSLDAILNDISKSMRTEVTEQFTNIEPCLGTILSQCFNGQEDAQEFWQKQASSAVVNSFPTMTPLREESQSVLTFTTSASMSFSKLHNQTQTLGVSVQALIQAAWTRVLSSYLGEDSVVFGVILSGRTTEETSSAPFPCLTTVPIIASNHSSNSDLLDAMMQYNSSLHKYQFSPLSEVQKWLGHAGSSVFDTLLVYQKLEQHDKNSRPWNLIEEEAKVEYPVSLEIEPLDNDNIQIAITYLSDVLPEGQAKLLVQQFDAAMENITCNPQGNEHEIYQEKPTLFAIAPAASPELSAPVQYLHQFVEIRAKSHPDRTALEFVGGIDDKSPVTHTWSYQEFDRIGNQVANLLKSEAPVGSIVAIHFEKCAEAYFSILGILKAGCSFVALDPSAPKARKEFILEDSQASCLLTSEGESLDFETSTKVLRIRQLQLNAHSASPRVLGPEFTANSTCYCLYTSGTTGTPKGCEITHENAVQAMMAFQELFMGHWSKESRWLQFAALHFDVSVLEQYWSWSVGITVVAAQRDLILDDLTAFINRLQITHIDLTPSLARLIHPSEVPSLCKGIFITGGEQLKQEILDAWGPTAVIYNAYGPTEATIGVTMYQRVPINGRPSNIGRQFSNVGSYVFQRGTEIPVFRGAVGELCISGKLVGKGYLNRPELTADRFPTIAEFGERVYRTGDLVRILHDGCFEFLGRADDQVKLRGQRLEIGEINHAIRTGVPNILDAATIVARQGPNQKDVLVSFLVAQATDAKSLSLMPDENELGAKARAACRERLPGYMVPTYFLRLSHIPLSPNNKLEAKKLQSLFGTLSHEELMKFTALMSTSNAVIDQEISRKVTDALAQFTAVKKEEISNYTSIFDLGVDSISALQLSTFLGSRGLSSASPTVLLKNPIVADLTIALSKKTQLPHHGRVVEAKQIIQACHHRFRSLVCRELAVKPGDIEYIAPCSPLQQGMLSKAMTDQVRGAYFNSFELKLESGTSFDNMRSAWYGLIESYPILRTAFVNTTEGYVQVALKHKAAVWHELVIDDNDGLDSHLQKTRQAWVQQDDQHIKNPLEFISVTGYSSRRLIVHIFHAVYDGNSFDLIMQLLLAKFRGHQPPPSPSFIDALAHGLLWRHDYCRKFWEQHLDNWTFSPVPGLSSTASDKPVSATMTIQMSKLETIRHEQNVTLQSVMLALWTFILQKYVPEPLTIGVIVGGRAMDLTNVENVVGPLFNTVPFFNRSLQGQTWASLIRKCHDFSSSVLSFQHVPLKQVQKWCAGGRPLFDNLFAFQVEHDAVQDDDLPWKVMDGPLNPDYPLAFEATRVGKDGVRVSLVAQAHIANTIKLGEILSQIAETIDSMARSEPFAGTHEGSAHHVDSGISRSLEMDESPNEETPYEWTDQAMLIRSEVAAIADVLSEHITAHKTLVELGLDSIDVLKLSARLKKKGINLSASQAMRLQTIAKMVGQIQTLPPTSAADTSNDNQLHVLREKLWSYVQESGLDCDTIESVLPPTALQESMVAGMLQSDFSWYFNHDILEIRPDVDTSRLQDAWIQVIDNSAILRTGFVEVQDQDIDMAYCQVIFKSLKLDIGHVELAVMADMRKITEEAVQKARMGSGQEDLVQLTLATIGKQRFLVLSLAHALYDGWSLGLLYSDLHKAYEGSLQPRPSPEIFLSTTLASRTTNAQAFWADYLTGASPTLLPEDASASSLPNGLSRNEMPSKKALSEISTFCKNKAISLQVLCQACWAMVLAHRTASLDVTFGVVLSNRDTDGSEELMFPTINTIALRCILHGSPSTFLKYLQESMADIRDFQAFPLRKAQLVAGIQGELFNSLFMLQKFSVQDSADALLTSVDGSAAVDYPVCVEAEAAGDRLIWRVACQSEFSAGNTGRLISELDQVLQFLLDPETSDILSFQEQQVSICGLPGVTIKSITDDNIQDASSMKVAETWNDTSSSIRKILSEASGIPEESIKAANMLYHLGLDSISAIKVSSLLRKDGISIKPRDLLRAKSITEMATLVHQTLESSDKLPDKPINWEPPQSIDIDKLLADGNISREQVEAILPALPMQTYMLGAWQNSDGTVFYPEFCYLVDKNTKTERITEAWHSLVGQTPILRTCLVATEDKHLPLFQVILKNNHGTEKPGMQPLVRFSVTADGPDGQLVIRLRIHHALYDGVSLPAILQRLSKLIRGEKPSISEDDISRWPTHVTQPTLDDSRVARREFWTNYLKPCPPSTTQTSLSPEDTSRTSHLQESAIPNTSPIRSLAATNGISIQALFLAAYAKTLFTSTSNTSDTSDAPTVVFGIYLANREDTQTLPPTYPTLNLVPLKVTLTTTTTLITLATAIQHDLHSISTNGRADVGLWEIAEWTGIKLTSFVNFLSLPETQDSSSPSEVLKPAQEMESAMDGESARLLLSHPWIWNNPVRDAFPAAVDVEASLQGQSMDIGIFGASNRISDPEASTLINHIVTHLEEAGR